jgi:Family of unknown function (DUF5990)
MTPEIPVTLHLTILHAPPGVTWAVQLGRDGLLPPVRVADDCVVFEVPVRLEHTARHGLQLRGAAIQGPPAARFLYANAGRRAADGHARWDRRAKVPLGSIDLASLPPGAGPIVLEGTMHGTARDGGPACASVPLIGGAWQLRASSAHSVL